MWIYLIAYIVILVIIGIFDSFKVKTFDDYTVAGRNKKWVSVFFSFVASCIGASTTIGIVNLSYDIGFPVVWWLLSGGICLTILGIFFADKIQAGGYYTLSDFAGRKAGGSVGKIIALIILLSWLGIIAAQFIAASKILDLFFDVPFNSILICVVVGICVYTYLGGQLSVLRTDILQGNLIIFTVIFLAAILFAKDTSCVDFSDIVFVNQSFTFKKVIFFFLVIGSTYFIGPDIFSRIFTAKTGKDAKIACILAGMVLAVISFFIVFIGVWAKKKSFSGDSILLNIIVSFVDKRFSWIFILGILSAVISSADTCLLTMCAIVEKDISMGKRLNAARQTVFVVGGLALCLALWKQDIVVLLMSAYKIFSAGVIPLITVILIAGRNFKIKEFFAAIAVLAGGIFGVLAVAFSYDIFIVYGMIITFSLTLIGLKRNTE
ncbi:MAG: sodium:solute symporter family protein [Candidatus Omnitrophica bacterium]|nr:sodium:solute symporter family protein [Candidatus Omnitrophota bacterium]MDD5080709.1 sodium:solute symporter family protein [Candidatus Omnitrophota bacterium]